MAKKGTQPPSSGRRRGTLFGKPRGQVVKRPGAFGKKAKAAGMSTSAYARTVLSSKGRHSKRTVLQANLARTFSKMRRKKR